MQLLHIWAQNERTARILEDTFDAMPSNVRSDTIVIISIAPNDRWLF